MAFCMTVMRLHSLKCFLKSLEKLKLACSAKQQVEGRRKGSILNIQLLQGSLVPVFWKHILH